MGLTEHMVGKLTELFNLLDSNGDGVLDITEFKKLGKVITGKEQSDEDTKQQIKRADKDSDAQLSLDEWLDFSSMLGRLSTEEFDTVIGGYISEVTKALDKK